MEENSHGPLVSTHVRTLAYTLSHRVHTCTYTHTRIEEQKGREEIRNRDAWPLEESETLKSRQLIWKLPSLSLGQSSVAH